LSAQQPNKNNYNELARRIAATAASAMLALSSAMLPANAAAMALISYTLLVNEISERKVEQLTFSADERGVFLKTVCGSDQVAAVLPLAQNKLVGLLLANNVPFSAALQDASNAGVGGFLAGLARNAFPLFLLASFLLPRAGGGGMPGGGGMGGGNPMEMGKSKSELQMEPNTGVKIAGVAGCEGSKLKLREVVEFLTDPARTRKWAPKRPAACSWKARQARQGAAGARGGKRSGRAVHFGVGVRVQGNVRGRGGGPRARSLRQGQEERAVHHFQRRN
jgi:hypothetical protein